MGLLFASVRRRGCGVATLAPPAAKENDHEQPHSQYGLHPGRVERDPQPATREVNHSGTMMV